MGIWNKKNQITGKEPKLEAGPFPKNDRFAFYVVKHFKYDSYKLKESIFCWMTECS